MANLKELVTYTIGNMYKLKWTGGGEVPATLSGFYTSQAEAQKAVDKYLRSRPAKTGAKKNAKDNAGA